MNSVVGVSVLQHVARDVKQRSGGHVSEAHGQMLAALPAEDLCLLQAASELVARRAVTKVTATPSGRCFFRVDSLSRFRGRPAEADRSFDATSQPFDDSMVSGSGANYYNCFAHYCSCAAFHEAAVQAHPTAMCKHMVARLLADATGEFERMEIEDMHFAQMLCPSSSEHGTV